MITISILTRNNLKITYKNIRRYRFEDNKIKIAVNDTLVPAYMREDIIDCYSFDDIKGIIIKKKGAKNAG